MISLQNKSVLNLFINSNILIQNQSLSSMPLTTTNALQTMFAVETFGHDLAPPSLVHFILVYLWIILVYNILKICCYDTNVTIICWSKSSVNIMSVNA